MAIFVRVLTALLPLAMTPLLLEALASGYIDLGAGEKDLVWLLPWSLWALVFAISALYLWRRGWSLRRALLRSTLLGLASVGIVGVVLAAFGALGVAGRF